MRVQLFMQFIEQVFCYTSMALFSSHFLWQPEYKEEGEWRQY